MTATNDPREVLALYIRSLALDDGGESTNLRALADDLERLPPDHMLIRAFERMPDAERLEFPNQPVYDAVETYRRRGPSGTADFYRDVLRALNPAMDAYLRADEARPLWASPLVSPVGWAVYALGGKRKKCPDCAERVKHDARVCRHCGYRFY